jgi:cytochrome c oxidase subunit 2
MLPRDVTGQGYLVDQVIWVALIGILIVGILSFLIVLYLLYRYRSGVSRTPLLEPPVWIKRVMYIDFVVMVLDLILLVLSTYGWAKIMITPVDQIRKTAEREGKPFIEAKVIGRQFFWAFHYPGEDGKFDTSDDFTLSDLLVVPEGSYVYLRVTSGDTLHSFFAPELRIKYDAIPGRETHVWFQPLQKGDFEVACAELCGPLHYKMKAIVRVLSPEDYLQWLRRMSHGGA